MSATTTSPPTETPTADTKVPAKTKTAAKKSTPLRAVPKAAEPPPPQSPKTVHEALVLALRNARPIAKDARNQHQGYSYISADAVIGACQKWMADAGLALTVGRTFKPFSPEVSEMLKPVGKAGRPATGRTAGVLVLEFSLYAIAAEDADPITLNYEQPVVIDAGRPLDKAVAAANTTALRYFLGTMFLIPSDSDGEVDQRIDDGGGAGAGVSRVATPPASAVVTLKGSELESVATPDEFAKISGKAPQLPRKQYETVLADLKQRRAAESKSETPAKATEPATPATETAETPEAKAEGAAAESVPEKKSEAARKAAAITVPG